MQENKEVELKITRTFDANRELVFKAWSDTKEMAKWFCPLDWELVNLESDFKVGGKWTSTMKSPKGNSHTMLGVYKEIVEPEKIKTTHFWDQDGKHTPETMISIAFEENDGKTTMHFTQTGFANDEVRNEHVQGWNEFFDHLEKLSEK